MVTKKEKFWIISFVVSIIIWFLWVRQYLTVSNQDKRALLDVNTNRQILIWLRGNQELKEKLEKTHQLFNESQDSSEKNKYLINEYQNMSNDLWLTDVEWQGIVLTLTWDVDVKAIIDIVNTLWFAGVKAISVSDQRLNAYSYISKTSQGIIINWELIKPPIKIAMIWDKTELEKYLIQPDWIVKRLKDRKITAEAQFFDMYQLSK